MHIDVLLSPRMESAGQDKLTRVVVIDVFRSTTVIATALHHGAQAVYPFASAEEAKRRVAGEGDSWLLGGEKDTYRIKGFQFGNSPFEYRTELIRGKNIALVTSNGTGLFPLFAGYAEVIAASLVNAEASINYLMKDSGAVLMVCAGSKGNIGLEDVVCAGFLIRCIQEKTDCSLSDSALAAVRCSDYNPETVSRLCQSAEHGKRLMKNGFAEDVDYCCTFDVYEGVPVLRDGEKLILVH